MEIKLTKEADKLLDVMFSVYRARRKEGQGKRAAARFDGMFLEEMHPFCTWPAGDLDDALNELSENGFVDAYVTGDCALTSSAIAFFEDRIADGFKEVTSYLSQFLP